MLKIIDIKYKKKTITLYFDNGETFDISENTKNEFFLYGGKEISAKDLKAIKHFEGLMSHFNYAVRVLSRGAYTTYEIKQKLLKRQVPETTIKEIIKRLKASNLLDDALYTKERINYLISHKGASKRTIISDLKRRGVDYFIIEDTMAKVRDFEVSELYKKITKLIKRYKSESLLRASQKILQKLYNEGYESKIINEAIAAFTLEDYINEDENLQKHYEKVVTALAKKGEVDPKVVYNKLSKAGYPHAKIKMIIKEHIYED